jgi:hypothetical protein
MRTFFRRTWIGVLGGHHSGELKRASAGVKVERITWKNATIGCALGSGRCRRTPLDRLLKMFEFDPFFDPFFGV